MIGSAPRNRCCQKSANHQLDPDLPAEGARSENGAFGVLPLRKWNSLLNWLDHHCFLISATINQTMGGHCALNSVKKYHHPMENFIFPYSGVSLVCDELRNRCLYSPSVSHISFLYFGTYVSSKFCLDKVRIVDARKPKPEIRTRDVTNMCLIQTSISVFLTC